MVFYQCNKSNNFNSKIGEKPRLQLHCLKAGKIMKRGTGCGVWGRKYMATGDVKAKRHNGVTAQRLLCSSAGSAVLQVNVTLGHA